MAALITSAVVITVFIIRLEGKVKTLQTLTDSQKNELSEITKQFRDIGIQYILSGMKRGEQGQGG